MSFNFVVVLPQNEATSAVLELKIMGVKILRKRHILNNHGFGNKMFCNESFHFKSQTVFFLVGPAFPLSPTAGALALPQHAAMDGFGQHR